MLYLKLCNRTYKKAENHTSKAIGLAVSSFLTLLTLFVTLSFSFV
ncbi:cation:proton antiporter [Enterococcus faecium]|nr:cation:proton antiporter [Enterococcus faecium]PLQ11259.1 cation:proton antiporter [Enterococcus faecium]